MRQSILLYLYTFCTLFTVFSCRKSFLDVNDNSDLNRQSFVKDLATIEQYLNGTYANMNGDLYEHGIGAAYPDLAADNLMPLPSGAQNLVSQYTWTQRAANNSDIRVSADAVNMNGSWKAGYLLIRSCSFIIENIDKYSSENVTKANSIKAQALAIRAMAHFKLVNIFAQSYTFKSNGDHPGIPYITTSDISAPYTRLTAREVYDHIIEDYLQAIELLSPDYSDTRYMNKMAVKALLARVYFYKEDYTNCKILAQEICNKFPLLSIGNGYPNDIFKNRKPSETEVLFQLTPVNVSSGGTRSRFLGAYVGTSAVFKATSDLAQILVQNPNDVRSGWVIESGGQWQVTKFPKGVASDLTPAISPAETSYYPPVVRSSEMFLTMAEIAAKANDETTARSYLDAIRQRADPTVGLSTETGAALLTAIYTERRKELCFEGFRMQDLQRWKQGVHRTNVNPLYPTSTDLPYPSTQSVAPIPLQEVTIAKIAQNENY